VNRRKSFCCLWEQVTNPIEQFLTSSHALLDDIGAEPRLHPKLMRALIAGAKNHEIFLPMTNVGPSFRSFLFHLISLLPYYLVQRCMWIMRIESCLCRLRGAVHHFKRKYEIVLSIALSDCSQKRQSSSLGFEIQSFTSNPSITIGCSTTMME